MKKYTNVAIYIEKFNKFCMHYSYGLDSALTEITSIGISGLDLTKVSIGFGFSGCIGKLYFFLVVILNITASINYKLYYYYNYKVPGGPLVRLQLHVIFDYVISKGRNL